VSALAFTPKREQPDSAPDVLNTNSHSQYYSLQRS